jgi:MFS family permease
MRDMHDAADAAPAGAVRFGVRLSVRQQLTLSILWFCVNFQSAALLPVVLPVQILPFFPQGSAGDAQQALLLSWLATAGGILALFIPPLVGSLSDRTTGAWGRRRPYIAAGELFLVLGAVVLAAPRGVAFLLAGLLIFQVGGSTLTAGYQGLLPDQVPQGQRGEASGYIGLMTILGNACSLGFAALLLGQVSAVGALAADASIIQRGSLLFYALTGLVLALGVMVTLVGVHEKPLIASIRLGSGATLRQRLTADWIGPWRSHNFRWVFLTRASVMLGLSLFMTYIEFYFAKVEHTTSFVGETAGLAVLALVGAATSALALGILSDRVGRVVLVCFASVCMALAALAFVVLPPGTPLWPLGLLFGVGYGAYSSVDWALAVDVLPAAEAAGKDMGLWSTATTLPGVLAPLVGGLVFIVVGFFGQTALAYRAVFALAALSMLGGAAFILVVRDTVGAPRRVHGRRLHVGWRLAFRTGAGRAHGFLRFWPFWERVTLLVNRQTAIPKAPYGLLKAQFARHHGRAITLPDGTVVRSGDRIAELHIQNHLLPNLASHRGIWELARMFAGDLGALAAWAERPDFPAGVKAAYGFTILGRGAARLGFTLRERPHTLRSWLDGFFLTGLLALYSPRGVDRLRQGTTYGSYPVEIWMSRGELRRRYGGYGEGEQRPTEP